MSGTPLPDPVGIVGLGALGGSLARALKSLPGAPRIVAHARDGDDVDAARREGVVDAAFDDPETLAGEAALVVLAVPLGAEGGVLRALATRLPEEAVVTDVASLQAPALDAAEEAGLGPRFVAGHPMAGTEASGFGAGHAGLFRGRRVWLSTYPDVEDGATESVQALWSAVGADPAWMDPDEHDARMAVASHLPQLTANALARILEDAGLRPSDLGPGGADMTRLAASTPEMWRDLLLHSGPQVSALLRLLSRELDDWAAILAGGDLESVARRMAATRRWRAG